MKRLLFLTLILFISTLVLKSQVFRKFSDDPAKYPGELNQYLGQNLSADDVIFFTDLIDDWNAGVVSDTNKSYIIALSNLMLNRNARPRPHYILFMRTFFSVRENLPDSVSFEHWKLAAYKRYSQSGTRLAQMHEFMLFSFNLVHNNIIHKTSATTWKFLENKYTLRYEDTLRLYFENTTLTCRVVSDSFNIYQTSGIYTPATQAWQGNSGLVTWERSGYDPQRVFAELPAYRLDLNHSEYVLDSVRFTNKNYLDYVLSGRLHERVISTRSNRSIDYPRFESYRSNFRIENLYENINYQGGLSMYGSTLIGSGTESQKAKLDFFRNDTLKLRAYSELFGMEPGRVTSQDVRVSIPIGFDSIVHPNIGMTYYVDRNELSLYKNQRFQSESPYYNNYHNVEMNFEQLSWKLDESKILFKMREASSTGLANFQSMNLFDARLYRQIQGIDLENPLLTLRRYSEKAFDISFTGKEFARSIRANHNQVQQLLKRLAILGFLDYDLEEDRITLRQKLYDWIYASVNSIDYDVINLISETRAPQENASLDLNTYDLTIYGIPRIRLSNAQNVTIFPAGARITMKQNRSFEFDGVISAGLFTLFGKQFFFDYDEFKLNLQYIDSLNLRVKTDQYDASGNISLLNVESIIQDITGELLIDNPENKSGRKDYPRYPVFRSRENSFVYYDDRAIQGGVYERDRFYFEIYPFEFDSLDNFTSAGVELDGRFVSAGILPDLEQTLIIREDNSLGFEYTTEGTGLPVYGGKGKYIDYLEMSNEGLRGAGRLEYLTASGNSDDVFFHPDSLFCTLNEFRVDQTLTGIEYPSVRSTENDIKWYPYRDTMIISGGAEAFRILNDSTGLQGQLTMKPSGLTGSGTMELTNSVLISENFVYGANIFSADTADLRLKSVNTTGYTLITDNVNASVDFSERNGIFRTNEAFSLVKFPENKYVSQLDLFEWIMDDNILVMGARNFSQKEEDYQPGERLDEPREGPRYISTDFYQDSLSFVSPSAVYDYRRNIIRASDVDYLKVADAFIFPNGQDVVIEPEGTMRQLDSASVMANTTSRYHNIFAATLTIETRNKYSGSGKYEYVDKDGKSQIIDFYMIRTDDSSRTTAFGNIPVDDEFTLSRFYEFTGEVSLSAWRQFLTFNGGARLVHDCELIDTNFIKFEAEINPAEIYIPVPPQPLAYDNNRLYSSIFITSDSAHIYPAFFSGKKYANDRYVSRAEGYLYYDEESDEYQVSSKEKLADRSEPGNYLSLSRSSCIQYGEGLIDLGIRLGQVRMVSYGNIIHDVNNFTSDVHVMLSLDFFMSEEALAIMATDLDSLQGLEAADLSDPVYVQGLTEILGKDRAGRMQAELGLYGEYQELPDELKKTLWLSDVQLEWNQETRSYWSKGKISIGSVNGNQIHKKVNGYIEFNRRRSGDLMDMYLELERGTWYYFGYTRGVMHVSSSSREYNVIISDLSTRKRSLKTDRNEIPYTFVIATARKRQIFLRKVEEMKQQEEMQ